MTAEKKLKGAFEWFNEGFDETIPKPHTYTFECTERDYRIFKAGAAWQAAQQVQVSELKAAERFKRALVEFQQQFWDSYYFSKGSFNISEMQRLDRIIIDGIIEGDELAALAAIQGGGK